MATGKAWAGAVASMLCVLTCSNVARADGTDYHEAVPARPTPRWLTLPIEYGHAAAWTRGGDGPVYRFTGSLLPGLVFGPLTLQAALQVVYRNPEWDAGIGGRVSVKVLDLVSGFVPLRILVESSHHPIHPGGYVAGGGSAGLGGLLYLAAMYGHDTDRPTQYFAVRLGVDILSLWDPVGAILRDVPAADIGRPASPCEPPGPRY